MLIDFILKSGKPLGVSAGLALQHDGASVWHDQPRPDQKHSVLPKRNLAIISADQLRSLRDEKISAGRTVVDVLRRLGSDLAGQVGAYSGDKRRGDDRTGLDHVSRCRVGQAVGAHGSAVDCPVQERDLAVLHIEERVGIDGWRIRPSGWWNRSFFGGGARYHGRRRDVLPGAGRGEQMAGARGFIFLRAALLLGINRHRRRTRNLRVEHGAAEVAWQRRPKRRHIPGHPGIVPWQRREAVRRRLVAGVVEFATPGRFGPSLVKRPYQGTGHRDRSDRCQPHQDLEREPRHWRPLRPKAQFGGDITVSDGLPLLLAHHPSLPSVRTMRTRRSEPRSPRRSSAAANRRSTIMWLARTR